MFSTQSVFDFLQAALPWLAIGLLLAIFFARAAKRKETDNPIEDYGSQGMALGMCFGVAIGSSTRLGVGLGLSLGMILGLLVGSRKKKDGSEK